MPNQYRKKPVVIEAIQFDGNNGKEINKFTGQDVVGYGYTQILTLEGFKPLPVGYWVIKGVKGEFYPCEPEIFSLTYEKET